jgi:S1-C subfamily serine protease
MRILAALFGAVIFFVMNGSTIEASWQTLVKEKLEKSVVQLSANCSGFVIHEAEDWVLTANHCGSDDPDKSIIVDLRPGKVQATDIQKDFLVLHVPGIDRPALHLATKDVEFGDVVLSFGYGGGYERPMLRQAIVAQPKALVPDAGPGEWVMFDAAFIGGMSGGPIVNTDGEVVALVQMSSPTMGLGRSADTLKDRIGRYFEKKKTP